MNNSIDSKVKAYPIWSRDNSKLLLAFILTVIAVYIFPKLGIPQIFIKLLFLFLLFIIFHSKDDVFWLSWFFVISDAPGRLLTLTSGSTIYRLPMYTLMSGISTGFTELFLIMYIIKFYSRKTKLSLFNKYAKVIIIYGIFTIAYSFILGISQSNLISSIRTILPWFWLLILPAFISDPKSVEHLFQLLAPFVFICFILSIQSQITGEYLHNILSGESVYGFLGEAETDIVRVNHAAHLLFILVFFALFYLSRERKIFNNTYLNLIIIIGFFTILLSATRGWIIALLILFSSVFFMKGYNLMKQFIRMCVIMGILIYTVQVIYPSFLFQISKSFERLSTLEALTEGDLTAGGTLGRLTERSPRVMKEFKKSPIIGWGFSNHYFAYGDMHVGNQSMLLQGGIVGFAFWMVIILLIFYNIFIYGRLYCVRLSIGSGIYVILFALIATFAIHSSSTHMWGFYGHSQATIFHWTYILMVANAYINYGKSYVNSNKLKNTVYA